MASPLDQFAPSSSFAFPDGSVLTIETNTRDHHITKDVRISHEDPEPIPNSPKPKQRRKPRPRKQSGQQQPEANT